MNVMEQCQVCGKRGIFKQVCYNPIAVFYECPVCDGMNIQWRIMHMKN